MTYRFYMLESSMPMGGVSGGFTLVEVAVTVLVLGLLLSFSVPAVQSISTSYQLKGATRTIAGQVLLARQKAIATGRSQTMHFAANWLHGGVTSDYHIDNGGEDIIHLGLLPRGITYDSIGVNPTMQPDGRSLGAGLIILRDQRGNRDTVSVQLSGLVLTR